MFIRAQNYKMIKITGSFIIYYNKFIYSNKHMYISLVIQPASSVRAKCVKNNEIC